MSNWWTPLIWCCGGLRVNSRAVVRILLYHQCIIYPEEERTRVPVCYGTGQYYHQSDITPDMQAVFDNTQYPDSIKNGSLNKLCQPQFEILVCKIIMDGLLGWQVYKSWSAKALFGNFSIEKHRLYVCIGPTLLNIAGNACALLCCSVGDFHFLAEY